MRIKLLEYELHYHMCYYDNKAEEFVAIEKIIDWKVFEDDRWKLDEVCLNGLRCEEYVESSVKYNVFKLYIKDTDELVLTVDIPWDCQRDNYWINSDDVVDSVNEALAAYERNEVFFAVKIIPQELSYDQWSCSECLEIITIYENGTVYSDCRCLEATEWK